MFLVKTGEDEAVDAVDAVTVRATASRTRGGVVSRLWNWWKQRCLRQHRRAAKRKLFLLETLVLGPKQKVFLMRCGEERFLVGTSPEGVSSMVRVDPAEEPANGAVPTPPVAVHGSERWG